MKASDVHRLPSAPATLTEAADILRRRELSAVELTELVLQRIEALEPILHCYITVAAEAARVRARELDEELARGRCRGPLHGIPVALKDVIDTKWIRTTAGTAALANHLPKSDAAIVESLERAGAIVIGKNNMHELSMGVTNANPFYGRCVNPWNIEYIPGGSSGGSAVAVAAGLAMGAVGGDSGGSVRIPAAYTNLVGFKPSVGLISHYGVFTGTWTLDSAGPITRTVRDNAILMNAIAGYDPRDGRSLDVPPVDYSAAIEELDLRSLRVGIPREFYFEVSEPEVREAVLRAANVFEAMGAQLIEVSIPHAEVSVDAGAIIAWSEYAVSQQALIETSRDLIGSDVRRQLELGGTHLAVHYIKAQQARATLIKEYAQAWQLVDVVLTPTTPVPPPKVGDEPNMHVAQLTRIASVTGEPAVSVPCGFTADGLPLGMHIQAAGLRETLLYQVAHTYEQATDWHLHYPNLDGLAGGGRGGRHSGAAGLERDAAE